MTLVLRNIIFVLAVAIGAAASAQGLEVKGEGSGTGPVKRLALSISDAAQSLGKRSDEGYPKIYKNALTYNEVLVELGESVTFLSSSTGDVKEFTQNFIFAMNAVSISKRLEKLQLSDGELGLLSADLKWILEKSQVKYDTVSSDQSWFSYGLDVFTATVVGPLTSKIIGVDDDIWWSEKHWWEGQFVEDFLKLNEDLSFVKREVGDSDFDMIVKIMEEFDFRASDELRQEMDEFNSRLNAPYYSTSVVKAGQ